MYRNFIKRGVDILGSALLLISLLPILLILSVLIAIFLGRPVLFCQIRPGLYGVPFRMIKFRTMTNVRDARGVPLPDEQRMTRFGKFLRATSLDELPELWNVLKGDMSLIGPRPLLMEYMPLYTPEQNRRHELRPGITGWAQINGRNAITWPEKFKHDVWYIENCGFGLDVKIIFLTIKKVLCREGIRQAGFATADKFTGQCNNMPTDHPAAMEHHHA